MYLDSLRHNISYDHAFIKKVLKDVIVMPISIDEANVVYIHKQEYTTHEWTLPSDKMVWVISLEAAPHFPILSRPLVFVEFQVPIDDYVGFVCVKSSLIITKPNE